MGRGKGSKEAYKGPKARNGQLTGSKRVPGFDFQSTKTRPMISKQSPQQRNKLDDLFCALIHGVRNEATNDCCSTCAIQSACVPPFTMDVLKWTQPMDDVVIDVLLHQQSLGNRVDKVFTTMAYENMVNELHEKIGMPIEKGRGGFAWGLDTKMWTAKPELWKALAKSKPDSKKWMTTRISNYDKLLMLFANDREKEDGAKGGQWTSSIGGVFLQHRLKGKNERLQELQVFQREFKSIREAIKDVAAERGRPRVYYSAQEVFAELVNIGVDTQLRHKAYTFLIANAARVRALFGCPAEERKEYLSQMMGIQTNCRLCFTKLWPNDCQKKKELQPNDV
ncbi:Myb/SANT-like domain - like 10 [Theobroma cacao]|nr:Myb/SANT-like domain - like 10 [Theobroma cacao]